MKFGIIGAGRMAHLHAEAIRGMAGGRLHSIVSSKAVAARELAAVSEAKACATLEEFLADPELEIVTIATPIGMHLEAALAAAGAGKHVIVERPLEISVERADRMIEACRSAGVVLSGIHSHRFNPALDALKTAVVEGRFGTLTLVDASVKRFRDQAWYDLAPWRGRRDLAGGGAFMSEGIEAIDQLLYLAGEVESAAASAACLSHAALEVEDTGAAILEFRSGARGVVQCATSCWSGQSPSGEVHVCGESGSALLCGERFRVWEFENHEPMDYDIRATLMLTGEHAPVAPAELPFMGHRRNFEDVVRAIRQGGEPAVSGAEARRALAVLRAIYESAGNGGCRVSVT